MAVKNDYQALATKDECCYVCLGPLYDEKNEPLNIDGIVQKHAVKIFPCTHKLHELCYQQSLQSNLPPRCGICRTPFTEEVQSAALRARVRPPLDTPIQLNNEAIRKLDLIEFVSHLAFGLLAIGITIGLGFVIAALLGPIPAIILGFIIGTPLLMLANLFTQYMRNYFERRYLEAVQQA